MDGDLAPIGRAGLQQRLQVLPLLLVRVRLSSSTTPPAAASAFQVRAGDRTIAYGAKSPE